MWFKKIYCPGTLYVSQNYACFESKMIDTQQIIKLSQVMKLHVDRKAVTFCIFIKTETRKWWFSVFVGWNKGEEAFTMLQELWKRHLNRAKNQLDVELHTTSKSKLLSPKLYSNKDRNVIEKKRANLDADGVFRRDSLLEQDSHEKINIVGNESVTKVILHEQKTKDYRQLFRLPDSEQLVDGYPHDASYYRRDYYCEGKIYLSDHFFCFYSLEEPTNDLVMFCIPLHMVTNIEKQNSLFGIVGNRFVIKANAEPLVKEFLISLSNRDKRFEEVWNTWKACKHRTLIGLRLRNQSILERFAFSSKQGDSEKIWGPMLKDTTLFSPRYVADQVRCAKLWQRYLALNGSGVTMLRTNDFPELCKRGIPDLFRGKIWMYGSGAMFKAAAQPFYYRALLDRLQNEHSQATEDIG